MAICRATAPRLNSPVNALPTITAVLERDSASSARSPASASASAATSSASQWVRSAAATALAGIRKRARSNAKSSSTAISIGIDAVRIDIVVRRIVLQPQPFFRNAPESAATSQHGLPKFLGRARVRISARHSDDRDCFGHAARQFPRR